MVRPVSDRVGSKYPDVETPTKIDELVVAKLRKLGIVPSDRCTDAEFLRRVCLDVTGTLPTPQETEEFLADASADFHFAAAVACFGMLLRDSQHKAEATYDLATQLAQAGRGQDESGYRAEFLKLVELAKALSGR